MFCNALDINENLGSEGGSFGSKENDLGAIVSLEKKELEIKDGLNSEWLLPNNNKIDFT